MAGFTQDEKERRKEALLQLRYAQENLTAETRYEVLRAAEKAQMIYQQLGDEIGVADALKAIVSAIFLGERGEDAAMERARRELENYRRLGDRQGEATMRLAQADVHLEMNRPSQALSEAYEAADQFKALKLDERHVAALIVVANAYLQKSNTQEALTAAHEALSLAEEVGDMRGEALSLQCIAKALCANSEIKDAMDAARKSLTIFRQTSDYRQQAAGLMTISQIHLARKRPADALRSGKDAFSLSKRMGDVKGQADALCMMSEAFVLSGSSREALAALKEARDAYNSMKLPRSEISALIIVSKARLMKAEYTDALSVLTEALDIAKHIDDRKAEAVVMQYFAAVELEMRRFEDCQANLNEAQILFREVEDWRGEADVLELQLRLQIKEVSRDSENTADEWRALFFDAGDRKGEARCVKEAARYFFEAGLDQQAESRAQEAQALYQELEDGHGEASALVLLAEVVGTFGDVHRGIQSAEEALELSKNLEDPQGQAAAYSMLAKVMMFEGGDAEEALVAAEKAHSLVKKALKGWATKKDQVLALQLVSEAGIAKLLKLAGTEEDEDAKEPDEEEQKVYQAIFDKALRAAEIAVETALNLDDRRVQGGAFKTLAQTHLVCRSYEGASDAAREGMKIALEIHDRSLEASFLMTNAEIHVAQNYLGKADEEAKKALSIYRELGDASGEEYAKSILEQMYGTTRGGAAAADHTRVPEPGSAPTAATASEPSVAVHKGPTKEYISESLIQLSANIVGDQLEIDAPLMEAGMDSLSAVEFRNQVRGLVPGVNLPASLIFDYPNLRSITDFIHSKASEQ